MAAAQPAPPAGAAAAAPHVSVVVDDPSVEPLALRRCRICFEEEEGVEPLVDLSCLCKGELARVHASCGNLWFGRRGSGVCELCNALAFQLCPEALAHYKQMQAQAAARLAETGRRDRTLQQRPRSKWDQVRTVFFLILFLCVAGAIWMSAMGIFRHLPHG